MDLRKFIHSRLIVATCLATVMLMQYSGIARGAENLSTNYCRRLGNGINLGNALEAPREGEWGVTLEPEYFSLIRTAGFNHVRIPVRWSAHAAKVPPYTIEPEFLNRVDWAVRQSLAQSLLVVLNVHHYEELEQVPSAQRARFLAIWKQIAEHFKDFPFQVSFEIYNEPANALSAQLWNQLLLDSLKVVRVSNPGRIVVLGPANWNNIRSLPQLEIPASERNILVTVHYYEPFKFTHQGASWVGADATKWLGTRWTDSASERAAMCADLDMALSWGKLHTRPIYIGEFGAYSEADMASRASWTAAVREEANRRNFPTAYWEFCSGFGAYDPVSKSWRQPLLNALTGIRTGSR